MATEIQRLPKVLAARGIGRSQHYIDVQRGLFTRPVRIGQRAVGWPSTEIESLNAARIAGKSDDEIRKLVVALETARTAV